MWPHRWHPQPFLYSLFPFLSAITCLWMNQCINFLRYSLSNLIPDFLFIAIKATTLSEAALPVCPLKILCFIEEIIYYWEYDFSSISFIRALKSSSSCAEIEWVLKLLSGVKIIIEIIFKARSQVLLKLFFKLNLNYKSSYRKFDSSVLSFQYIANLLHCIPIFLPYKLSVQLIVTDLFFLKEWINLLTFQAVMWKVLGLLNS